MSVWGELFLGVIAVATLATAIMQIGLLVAAGRLVKRLMRLTEQVDQELKPIFGHLQTIANDAAHATSLARGQVERADRLVSDVLQRVEQIVATAQSIVTGPVRDGAAVLSAVRAAFNAFRGFKNSRARARRPDDEDALFI